MKPTEKKIVQRERRKRRVRRNIFGTPERPRLTVFRSHKNIYAQIIDDSAGKTLVAASSQEKVSAEALTKGGGNRTAAIVVGQAVAAKAVERGIKKVVFDRNGYPYHGRIRELADAARKAGLEF
jgi:large subunit ribosomal protein L18